MAVAIEVSGSQSSTADTEHELASTDGSNDLPVSSTYVLTVDLNDLAIGETVTLRCYTKARAADTKRLFFQQTFQHAQATPGYQSIPVPTAAYTEFSLECDTSSVSFPWAVYDLTSAS